jgi:hypothetical protein
MVRATGYENSTIANEGRRDNTVDVHDATVSSLVALKSTRKAEDSLANGSGTPGRADYVWGTWLWAMRPRRTAVKRTMGITMTARDRSMSFLAPWRFILSRGDTSFLAPISSFRRK